MKAKGRRIALSFITLVCLLVAVPAGLTWRIVRREWLDQGLIAAIVTHQDQTALSLLEQGADARARGVPWIVPRDRRSLWQRLLDVIMHRQANPAQRSSAPLLPALMLLMRDDETGRNDPSLAVARALLERGADPNEPDTTGGPIRGFTPLMWATADNRADLIRLMTAHGGNPNQTDGRGSLPLAFIIHQNGHPPALFWMYMSHRPIGGGRPMLLCAAGWGKPESVKALLEAHADVNVIDEWGETALGEAVRRDKVENVKVLLEYDADFRQKDEDRRTPLQEAKRRASVAGSDPGYHTIITLLQQAGAKN